MKGIYVLVISINEGVSVDVGALGTVDFERGLYAYVGSAQNALEKRVERHLEKVKRRFWHIDYLLDNIGAKVLKIFWKEAGKLEECRISAKIRKRGVPISGFGSSGCKCESHLFRIEDSDFSGELMRQISVKAIRKAV